jgi:lysyl-tRNA synthetase class II
MSENTMPEEDKRKELEDKLIKSKARFFDMMAQQQQINQMLQRQIQEVNNIQAEINSLAIGGEVDAI